MDAIGENLTLLSIRTGDGRLNAKMLGFGLMGSELVRMAAHRRIDIVKGRIVVLDPTPTGDRELDTALAGLVAAKKSPKAKDWVARPRPNIHLAYLERLAAGGTVRADRSRALGLFPTTRWRVVDTRRLADAKAQLDAIAQSTGPVDSEQAAFGGLAHAVGLGLLWYSSRKQKDQRRRLEEIAKGKWSSRAVAGAITATNKAATAAATAASVQASVDASVDAATRAATDAAVDAATQAATDAAVNAAVQAATDAAVNAAVQAATDAAVHAAVQASTEAAIHAATEAAVHAAGQAAAQAGHDGGSAGGGHH